MGPSTNFMVEFEFLELNNEEKILLLSAHGYEVNDQGQILDSISLELIRSEISHEPLTLDSAALLPGSLKVVDSHPAAISKYLREHIESNGY